MMHLSFIYEWVWCWPTKYGHRTLVIDGLPDQKWEKDDKFDKKPINRRKKTGIVWWPIIGQGQNAIANEKDINIVPARIL